LSGNAMFSLSRRCLIILSFLFAFGQWYALNLPNQHLISIWGLINKGSDATEVPLVQVSYLVAVQFLNAYSST
jgi:hypothetical protein